ncbi:MAG TPA: hypothetical protein V6D29_13695 [Leptolyngbyaceae cyanobacterium]
MKNDIERKFKVDDWRHYIPQVDIHNVRQIKQGYLSELHGIQSRVRINRYEVGAVTSNLAVLVPQSEGTREVFEYAIPLHDAERLFEIAPYQIKKVRQSTEVSGWLWVIDEFENGLVMAEVKVKTLDAPIQLPAWIGEEVTGDPEYSNLSIAKRTCKFV